MRRPGRLAASSSRPTISRNQPSIATPIERATPVARITAAAPPPERQTSIDGMCGRQIVIKATGTSVVSAMALSIVVPGLLGSPDVSFADGQYRLKLAVFKPH